MTAGAVLTSRVDPAALAFLLSHMPDSDHPGSDADPLAQAARTLDEAVARLERASETAPRTDRTALAEAAARLDALIRKLDDEVSVQED